MLQKKKTPASSVQSRKPICFDIEGLPPLEQSGKVYKITAEKVIPVPETQHGDRLLLPVGEGMVIPVDTHMDGEIFSSDCIERPCCCGEKTMRMVLIDRGGKFLLISPADGMNSGYKLCWNGERYHLFMTCSKKMEITYAVFDSLAAACLYYRQSLPSLPVTLQKKIERTPALGQLLGGAIFWVWNPCYDQVMYADTDTYVSPETGEDMLKIAEDLHKSGVDRALFGIFFEKDSCLTKPLSEKFGYLTTQYDNYNDVLNPETLKKIPSNRARNCDYTQRRMKDYPDGIQIAQDGKPSPAWAIKGYDGEYYTTDRLCPKVAAQRIREEVPKILEQYPAYTGRFIDVFGTSLGECFSPLHPVSKEACRDIKIDAFASLRKMGLVVGTEDGFEDIINELDYSEGLHSPSFFRDSNAGRLHTHTYNEEQTAFCAKYMLDPAHRVPMWHLVYHDCMMAFPYWGDSTEMSPEQIRQKTLFACLYGCPPLYSFSLPDYPRLRKAILESYRTISAVHRAVAQLPMTDYAVLTADYAVQRTVFGNRYAVTVNFSRNPYKLDGVCVKPFDLLFEKCK